ncbi:Myosin-1, partial [Termitomyces sp. T112]
KLKSVCQVDDFLKQSAGKTSDGRRVPHSCQVAAMHSAKATFARHKFKFIIGFVVGFVFLLLLSTPTTTYRRFIGTAPELPQIYDETVSQPKVKPPTYESLRKWEDNLPQHDLDLPFPEGKTGRYVKFSNQIAMLGWNNVLNEVLMNAHLAYASKRAYVFQDYIWKPEYYPWPESQRLQNPPHTPLGALIGGTVVGQPFDDSDNAPRSVSSNYFEKVCPSHERRIIYTGDIKPSLAWKQGTEIFDHWAKLLLDAPELCIEVQASGEDNFPQTFDLWLWGSDRVLSLWDSFSTSPTSRLLTTSPIVGAAVKRNEYLFVPRGPRPAYPVSADPYARMLSMHIRRGDFKGACTHLAYWNSTFYSWNQLPKLPDRFIMDPNIPWNSTEYFAAHAERCLPDSDTIIKKARNSRDDYVKASPGRRRTLDIMYLLTNEKGEWMEKLKAALHKDGWNTIVTSNDLELDSEGVDTNMAIDMEIARKAAVFVGNGWSSFTSNINHRRLVDGKEFISIRFW